MIANTLPNRRTIRLKGYDYSSSGMYFVTICTQDKLCLFGEVIDSEMVLNDFGKIAYNEWNKTLELRSNIELGEFIIMPNHMHGIIIINTPTPIVGANCIRPNKSDDNQTGVCNTPLQPSIQTLGSIISGYKSAVARQTNNSNVVTKPKIWQRNYYEHIIRNEKSYNNITDYIASNPINWQSDDYFINKAI